MIGGCGGGDCVLKVEKMAKWSDGLVGRQVIAGMKEGSVGVITRSRMLWSMCVGKVMC